MYLVQRLAITKDEIHGPFDSARFEVMSTFVVIQRILVSTEIAIVKGGSVSRNLKSHRLSTLGN